MEEYLIAKVMTICEVPYGFARSIVIDLNCRELEEDLLICLENGTINSLKDLYELYY